MGLTKIGKEGITGISNSSDATAITIDSSERVGIGITPDTTSNGKSLQINRSVINDDDGGSTHITQNGYYNSAWKYVEDGTAEKISLVSGTIRFDNASSNSSGADASLTWSERMRIDTNGYVYINATSSQDSGMFFVDGTGENANCIIARVNNNLFWNYVGNDVNGTNTFLVYGNGNVQSATNSYGSTSDEKLKENIEDSGSQWDDIKAVKVKKFSLKSDKQSKANMLGVIAQDLEASGMNGLVENNPDRDEDMNDVGTVTKSVKYSILYMKAIKALQEAMSRIEILEAEVAKLKG